MRGISLRIDIVEHAGKRNRLADVLDAADPEARISQECRGEAVEAEAGHLLLPKMQRVMRLLASEDDVGVPAAVRRGGRTRKAPPGERIGRRSRYS